MGLSNARGQHPNVRDNTSATRLHQVRGTDHTGQDHNRH